MSQQMIKCGECSNKATYVRSTQFSGDHYFCTKCAKKESNFGENDPSYFRWYKLNKSGQINFKDSSSKILKEVITENKKNTKQIKTRSKFTLPIGAIVEVNFKEDSLVAQGICYDSQGFNLILSPGKRKGVVVGDLKYLGLNRDWYLVRFHIGHGLNIIKNVPLSDCKKIKRKIK